MSIGSSIKKLRRERNMTQEQLAERLGITANAVSQWECDRTAPDISQIPMLVRIFGVSADTLLEIDQLKTQEEIEKLIDEINALCRKGLKYESFVCAEKAYRKYPDDECLMFLFATSFGDFVHSEKLTKEQEQNYYKECIKLLETIVKSSTEEVLRQGALNSLLWMYRNQGQMEKAEEIVDKFPILVNSREFLLAGLFGGNKGILCEQRLLFALIDHLSNRMVRLRYTDEKAPFHTEDEFCHLYKKRLAFLELMFEKGDYGFFYDDIFESNKWLAGYYAKQKNAEETLYYLEQATKAAVRYMHDFYQKEYVYTSLLLKGYEESGCNIFYSEAENHASRLISYMQSDIFDFVKDNPRLESIKEQLHPLAGNWNT